MVGQTPEEAEDAKPEAAVTQQEVDSKAARTPEESVTLDQAEGQIYQVVYQRLEAETGRPAVRAPSCTAVCDFVRGFTLFTLRWGQSVHLEELNNYK